MFRTLAAAAWVATAGVLAAQAGPATPGVLTLAWEAEPRTIDPRYAVDANSQYLEDLLHCALISPDAEGQLKPLLARSWQWTTPTTLKVELQPNIKFADGTTVTASDVAATYQFFKNTAAPKPSPRRGAFAGLVSTTAVAATTVVFTLREPDASFVANLIVGILPAATAAGNLISAPHQAQGCGPFILSALSPSQYDLVPNPNYSLGAPSKLQKIALKIVKDENTRYAKLIAGELDLVQNLLSRDKLTVIARSYPKLKLQRRSGLNTTYLGFNIRDKKLSQVNVRRAIAMAIDKDKIIKYVLNGMAVPAATMLLPSDPFYSHNLKAPDYNPKQARALLDQAGFKASADGIRFSLSFKTTTDQTRVAVAKAIGAELRQVGINVTVESLEWGRFKADVEHGHVQMWSLGWVGFKDPDIYRFAFATASFPPDGGNRGWYSNPVLDQLLDLGRSQTSLSERTAVYAKAQQIIADDVPYAFLWHEDVFAISNQGIEGFEVYADGRLSALSRTSKP